MRPFTYLAPKSLDEAFQALAQANGEVRPLVGGTDLIDQMRQNRRTPSVVMDVKRIPETMRLEYVAGEGLHIGSAVPCTDTAAYAQVGELYPAIQEACLLVGSIAKQCGRNPHSQHLFALWCRTLTIADQGHCQWADVL